MKLGLQECKSSPKFKYINYSLVRLLRMALFFQCIINYPSLIVQSTSGLTVENEKFEKVLKANLKGDESELLVLMDFLRVDLKGDKCKELVGPELVQKGAELEKEIRDKRPRKMKKQSSEEFDKSMLLDSLAGKEETMEDMVEVKANKLKSLKMCDMKVGRVLDLNSKEYTFSFETLPANFYDCYQTYIYKSCEKCKKSQSKRSFGLCLLCGSLQCVIQCTGNDSKSKRNLPSPSWQLVPPRDVMPRGQWGLPEHQHGPVHHLPGQAALPGEQSLRQQARARGHRRRQ